jgi:acyl-CoA synthetase (AMP-forming)/AMP-acid ligase II
MNFAQGLLATGEPDAVALLTETASHTYAELRAAVGAVARTLGQQGIRRGECVAILSESSLFGIAAYLGAIHAGAVAVPLPTNLGKEQFQLILRSTRARVAFVQSKAAPDFAQELEAVEQLLVDDQFSLRPDGASPIPEPAQVNAKEELAALLFTSGSTSQPRGVMLSHRNLEANTESIVQYLELSSSDRAMMVLPYYYSFGASLLHTHLKVGASLVLDRRFMFPDKVLRRMVETRCTGFAGVPSHFQVLLRRSQLKSMRFPDLRWVQQAGGKLPSHFIQELRTTLDPVRIFIMYGATEASARLCYLPPAMLEKKLGSVGRAIPGVTIELLDEAGQPVPAGAVGEIVASGENISQGYFRAPEETRGSFRNGRLHTGDLARMDEDGFLFIVDRAKDFIKCAGNRTSTKMLEELLLEFPDIVEAAVLGVPDETLGEAVGVFVVPRAASDATIKDRFLTFAAEKLPQHLVPRLVQVLPGLPKNNAGKVMKLALRQQLEPGVKLQGEQSSN